MHKIPHNCAKSKDTITPLTSKSIPSKGSKIITKKTTKKLLKPSQKTIHTSSITTPSSISPSLAPSLSLSQSNTTLISHPTRISTSTIHLNSKKTRTINNSTRTLTTKTPQPTHISPNHLTTISKTTNTITRRHFTLSKPLITTSRRGFTPSRRQFALQGQIYDPYKPEEFDSSAAIWQPSSYTTSDSSLISPSAALKLKRNLLLADKDQAKHLSHPKGEYYQHLENVKALIDRARMNGNIICFTDGSSLSNPGPAGCGISIEVPLHENPIELFQKQMPFLLRVDDTTAQSANVSGRIILAQRHLTQNLKKKQQLEKKNGLEEDEEENFQNDALPNAIRYDLAVTYGGGTNNYAELKAVETTLFYLETLHLTKQINLYPTIMTEIDSEDNLQNLQNFSSQNSSSQNLQNNLNLLNENMKKIFIVSDSDWALKMMIGHFKPKEQYVELVSQLRAKLAVLEMRYGCRFEFLWCKGHVNIQGNELADSLSFQAATLSRELMLSTQNDPNIDFKSSSVNPVYYNTQYTLEKIQKIRSFLNFQNFNELLNKKSLSLVINHGQQHYTLNDDNGNVVVDDLYPNIVRIEEGGQFDLPPLPSAKLINTLTTPTNTIIKKSITRGASPLVASSSVPRVKTIDGINIDGYFDNNNNENSLENLQKKNNFNNEEKNTNLQKKNNFDEEEKNTSNLVSSIFQELIIPSKAFLTRALILRDKRIANIHDDTNGGSDGSSDSSDSIDIKKQTEKNKNKNDGIEKNDDIMIQKIKTGISTPLAPNISFSSMITPQPIKVHMPVPPVIGDSHATDFLSGEFDGDDTTTNQGQSTEKSENSDENNTVDENSKNEKKGGGKKKEKSNAKKSTKKSSVNDIIDSESKDSNNTDSNSEDNDLTLKEQRIKIKKKQDKVVQEELSGLDELIKKRNESLEREEKEKKRNNDIVSPSDRLLSSSQTTNINNNTLSTTGSLTDSKETLLSRLNSLKNDKKNVENEQEKLNKEKERLENEKEKIEKMMNQIQKQILLQGQIETLRLKQQQQQQRDKTTSE